MQGVYRPLFNQSSTMGFSSKSEGFPSENPGFRQASQTEKNTAFSFLVNNSSPKKQLLARQLWGHKSLRGRRIYRDFSGSLAVTEGNMRPKCCLPWKQAAGGKQDKTEPKDVMSDPKAAPTSSGPGCFHSWSILTLILIYHGSSPWGRIDLA